MKRRGLLTLAIPAISSLLCGWQIARAADLPASPRDAESAFQSGQLKVRANDLSGARADFERAVAEEPDNERYLNALALVYLRTSEGGLAVRTYGRSCSIIETKFGRGSRLFGCHTLLGNALLLTKDLNGAEASFRSAYGIAFAQDPRSADDCLIALYYLAQTLSESSRLGESVPLYDQLLAVTSPANRRFSEIEDALRRVRTGQMPLRLLR